MTIRYEQVSGHVVVITIDRPERRNALDLDHMRQLGDAWRRFAADPNDWVAVITGVGRAFCAGADLASFFPSGHLNAQDALSAVGVNIDGQPDGVLFDWLLKGLELHKPIIAAVNGPCVAGGFELLAGTDIRLATKHARFGLTEPRRGLIAGGGSTVRLPRQLTWPAAMEFLLTGEAVSAKRALQLGLLNKIVSEEQLMESALEWAGRIARNAPLSIQATKESALQNLAAPSMQAAYALETKIAMRVAASNDSIEGARAFVEKRPPSWRGT
jgi:enoyl-CoA hydratase